MIADDLYDEMHMIVCPFCHRGETIRSRRWSASRSGRNEEIPKYRLIRADKMGDYIYTVLRTQGKASSSTGGL